MTVRCVHCGYTWDTRSNLANVSCPSCGLKTPNRSTSKEVKVDE